MTRPRIATALLLVATGALTACGSSSDSGPAQPAAVPPAQTAPTVSTPAKTSGSVVSKASKDPVIQNAPTVAHASKPTKSDESETDTSTAGNPCRLVTRSEARAIVGGRVAAPQTAPLGPTCIYRASRTDTPVTLSVLRMDVGTATKGQKGVIRASVAGHHAYCVKAGGLKMLVPLNGGKVLSVGAPCPIAARFATRALVRVGR